jgi:hypothetical protein
MSSVSKATYKIILLNDSNFQNTIYACLGTNPVDGRDAMGVHMVEMPVGT